MNWSVTKSTAPASAAETNGSDAEPGNATKLDRTQLQSIYWGGRDRFRYKHTERGGKKLKRTLHWAMTSLPLTSLARRGDGQIAHLASKKRRKKNQDFKMRLPWFTAAAINRSNATDTPPKYALPSLSMTNECCQTGQRRGRGAGQHTAIDTSLPDSPGIAQGISRPYVPLKCIRATG